MGTKKDIDPLNENVVRTFWNLFTLFSNVSGLPKPRPALPAPDNSRRDRLIGDLQKGFFREDFDLCCTSILGLTENYISQHDVELCIMYAGMEIADCFGAEKGAAVIDGISALAPESDAMTCVLAKVRKSLTPEFVEKEREFGNAAREAIAKSSGSARDLAPEHGIGFIDFKRGYDALTNWVSPQEFLKRYEANRSLPKPSLQ